MGENPYEPPNSGLASNSLSSKRFLFWKVYFFLAFILPAISIIRLVLDPVLLGVAWDILVIVSYVLVALVIYGYINRKPFISKTFWVSISVLMGLWDIWYIFYMIHWIKLLDTLQFELGLLINYGTAQAVIVLLSIPKYLVFVKYIFRSNDIWKNGRYS